MSHDLLVQMAYLLSFVEKHEGPLRAELEQG